MFKGLGNLAGMVQQARELQQKMAEAKERVAHLRVEGSAGGEMVKAVVTGDLRVQSLTIEPSLIAEGDQEVLEDLITAAVNQGLQKAKDAAATEMSEAAGGLDLPGLQDMMSKMGLGQ